MIQLHRTRTSDELIRELIKVVESMIGAVIERRLPHEIEDDWEQVKQALTKAKQRLGEV